MSEATPRTRAHHALKQAGRAAKAGDLAACERWTKLAERHAAAAAQLASLPPEPDSYEDDEALRAEIRARVMRYVEVDREMREWDFERQVHEDYSERAAREGLPPAPPLRPCPYTGFDLERYARSIFADDERERGAVDDYCARYDAQSGNKET